MVRRIMHISLWLSGLALICLGYGFLVEPHILKIRHVTISSDIGPAKPVKIVLASDIHMAGHHMSLRYVDRIVRTINSQSPDIILLGGDYVNGHEKRAHHGRRFNTVMEAGLNGLSALSATHGTYAVLGNHDAWYDAPFIARRLMKSGLNVLENQAAYIKDYNLCIVGLEDEDTGKPDRNGFYDCPVGTRKIALMHSPDSFQILPSDTLLAVAGHTHGGQINIPIIARRVTMTDLGQKYAYGLKTYDGIPVYITAGIGTSVLPARFRAPPEIVIITLQRGGS